MNRFELIEVRNTLHDIDVEWFEKLEAVNFDAAAEFSKGLGNAIFALEDEFIPQADDEDDE